MMVDGAQFAMMVLTVMQHPRFAMMVGVLTMPMSCADRWGLEQPLKQFVMPNLGKAAERFVKCYDCSFF